METVLNIHKRNHGELRELGTQLCLICQWKGTKFSNITSDATLTGITSLKNALLTRMKFRCDKYVEAIETLNNNLDVLNNNSIRLVYHKSCYSSFCSKSHLDRLRKKV